LSLFSVNKKATSDFLVVFFWITLFPSVQCVALVILILIKLLETSEDSGFFLTFYQPAD